MVSAESLNEDVLERIFTFLDFKDLLQAELCCLKWRRVITERRMYRQLSRRICRKTVNVKFSRLAYNKHLKEVRKAAFQAARFHKRRKLNR